MNENILPILLGSVLAKLPVIVVCIVSLIALVKSKNIPIATVRIARFGFICLLLNVSLSIVHYVISVIYRGTAESSATLGLKLVVSSYSIISLVNLILYTVGLALIARAIFSGRSPVVPTTVQTSDQGNPDLHV